MYAIVCSHVMKVKVEGVRRELGARYILNRFRPFCTSATIMKTCLFKYIENFTTKKENFQINNSDIFFIFLLKT